MATAETKEDIKFWWKWRNYLLLLATLVARVTYVAGLNPPGGVRSEDGGPGRDHRVGVDPPLPPAVYPNRVGDPVLVSTYSSRYTAFFYCNAAAFVASLVVIVFLLDRRFRNNAVGLTVLRSAMMLDLLALMAAFAAGSCRDVVASMYVLALFAIVFAYVAIHVHVARLARKREAPDSSAWPPAKYSQLKEQRRFMLLLATFATPLTYGAGLAPPGGFWSQSVSDHRADAPLLHDGQYKIRYHAFFYANASSFVASLAIIMLLMSRSLSGRLARSYALLVCTLVELLGLMVAFAAGSCRWTSTTVYIISLVGAVLLYFALQVVIAVFAMDTFKQWRAAVCRVLICANLPSASDVKQAMPLALGNATADAPQEEYAEEEGGVTTTIHINNGQAADKVEESRSPLLRLLATLAATVTYQAGLSPPGGVWTEGHPGHIPGYPVLLDIHPKRYKAFYHCNTAAFVASLVVIIIVQSKELSSGAVVRRAAFNTVMILGLIGLIGAYVAGSCRDTPTTIYVFALLAVFVVYGAYGGQSKLTKCVQGVGKKLVRALLRLPPDGESKEDDDHRLKTKHKFMLLLAILAATVTYHTGLNPPGGFWPGSNVVKNLTAGDPVLLDYYWTRYQIFFYGNATGFTASVSVILLLVNRTLYKQSIRGNAFQVCIIVGLLGLMGACAAGSSRKLRTTIYVFALVVAVVTFFLLQTLLYVSLDRDHWSELPWLPAWVKVLIKPLSTGPAPAGENKSNVVTERNEKSRRERNYLMLLGVLGASATYQAGLAPPDGTWGDDDNNNAPSSSTSARAGNPILLDSSEQRYQAFFYCNATSFVASVVVIMLLLQNTVKRRGAPMWAMQTALVLDLLGLLGAYAAGSSRDWETSAYVIALVAVVVVFITLHVLLSFDAVLNKARKLKAWKYFGGGNDVQVSRDGANV